MYTHNFTIYDIYVQEQIINIIFIETPNVHIWKYLLYLRVHYAIHDSTLLRFSSHIRSDLSPIKYSSMRRLFIMQF